ncbi:MAG TPA: lytic transglycosylase domain-containing protein [Gemmatimonadaceae bacterium]|nr:lytic transglycosylase domain-containing protein [Gemmatimonadaceae bacterium]
MNITDKRYSHRGDGKRRKERIGKFLLVAGLVAAVAYMPRQHPTDAEASTFSSFTFAGSQETARLRAQLDATKGELALAHAQLERAKAIMSYSSQYKVNAATAEAIYDVALAEGVDPDLGFRLVRVESEFNPRAVSSVGAVGLTQLMPSTARYFDKNVTREQLFEPRTNLRIGFRYLRSLITEYDGDVRLALLVYNRGPVAVETLRSLGVDPGNGYAKLVMKGWKGGRSGD